jgi:hypothetical protein
MFVRRALQTAGGNQRPLATLWMEVFDIAEVDPRIPQAPEEAR